MNLSWLNADELVTRAEIDAATPLELALLAKLREFAGDTPLRQRLEEAESEACEIDDERMAAESKAEELEDTIEAVRKILDGDKTPEEKLVDIEAELP